MKSTISCKRRKGNNAAATQQPTADLGLECSASTSGSVWSRLATNALNLEQSHSDFYAPNEQQGLIISQAVEAYRCIMPLVDDTLILSHSNTFAGCLCGVPTGGSSTLDPISSVFDSATVQGQVVYVTPTGSAGLALADNENTTEAIGLANEDVAAGATGEYVTEGQVTRVDWTAVAGTASLTPGATYFLSDANPGQVTTSAPTGAGHFVVSVGRAISSDTLDIEVQPCVQLSGNVTPGAGTQPLIDAEFASGTLTGMAVYVTPTGIAGLAQGDVAGTAGAIGFAFEDVLSGATGQYATEGQITRTDWTAVSGGATLIPGDVYYLSTTTPGQITNVKPTTIGEYCTPLGRAIGLNTIDIEVHLPTLIAAQSNSNALPATFDSNAVIGQPIYVASAGSVDLAQADAVTTTGVLGFTFEDVSASAVGSYVTEGQITKTDWTAVAGTALLTPGDLYFLSESSAGQITNVAPSAAGEHVVVVGRAVSDTVFDIEIDAPILLTGNISPGGDASTIEAVFDADAVIGNALYVPSSGHVTLARANAQATTGAIGLAFTDTLSGNTGEFVTEGVVQRGDWTSIAGTATLVAGDVYYLSPSVPGRITNTAPTDGGDYVVMMGRAISETEIDLEVSRPVALTAGTIPNPGGNTNTGGGGNSTITATFDQDAEIGAVVYVSGDGTVDLAQANADPMTRAVGLVPEGAVGGFPGDYIVEGQIINSGWDLVSGGLTLVPGDTYYLDPDTPGNITNVAPTTPGQYIVVIGHALTSTTLDVEIGEPILLSGNTSSGGGSGGTVLMAIHDSVTSPGQPVYISASGHVDLAQADAEATAGAVGFSVDGAALVGDVEDYIVEGQILLTDWTAVTGSTNLVAGDTYFLDVSNPGMITNVAPTAAGEYVVVMGRALTSTMLDIEVGQPVLLTGNTSTGTPGSSAFVIETFTINAAQALSGEIQLTGTVLQDSEFVFLNGLHMLNGATTDYTLSGSPTLITFDPTCLEAGDVVAIKYME